MTFIRRHPLISFYLLAFLLSWLGWVPQGLHARGQFPFDSPLFTFLGSGGPALAAVIVLLLTGQRDQLPPLFRRLFQPAALRWLLVVLGFWIAAPALALASAAVFEIPALALKPFDLALLPMIFLMMAFSNFWEEIGWRGFALPRFPAGWGDLPISAAMALLWQLWHLPLALDPAAPRAASGPWGLAWELVFSFALTVIYTWLYRRTGGSLLYVTLFHALSNTAAYLLLELGVFGVTYPRVVGLAALAAAAIVWYYGSRRFEKPGANPKPQMDAD